MALEEINQAGGVLGKKVDLIIEDDTGEPSVGIAAAEKLLTRDKVVALIGATPAPSPTPSSMPSSGSSRSWPGSGRPRRKWSMNSGRNGGSFTITPGITTASPRSATSW